MHACMQVTYTELYPGPRTIVFKETRAIAGNPEIYIIYYVIDYPILNVV